MTERFVSTTLNALGVVNITMRRAVSQGEMNVENPSSNVTIASTRSTVLQAGRSIPVIEIFGPTIQGEGSMVGTPCYFIRTGGCDYRCSWCDTPHAVLPEQVRVNRKMMTPAMILHELDKLPGDVEWIIISGGNPAILDLSDLVMKLQLQGYKVAVETQGSKYPSWLLDVDLLTISPKPPSSGMETDWFVLQQLVFEATDDGHRVDLKVVVFDEADMEYAKRVRKAFPNVPMYMSTGTFVGTSTRDDILDRMVETVRKGLVDPDLAGVRYGMQLHVLLWGHIKGV